MIVGTYRYYYLPPHWGVSNVEQYPLSTLLADLPLKFDPFYVDLSPRSRPSRSPYNPLRRDYNPISRRTFSTPTPSAPSTP